MVPFSISTDIGWRADLLNVSKVPEDVSDETLYVYGYDDRHLLYPNYKERHPRAEPVVQRRSDLEGLRAVHGTQALRTT